MLLSDNITSLKGVGQQRAALLRSLNIHTLADLIEYFPRDYLDRSVISKISQLQEGQIATIKASTLGRPQTLRKTQKTITKILFADETGRLELTWFNQPYIGGIFRDDAEYLISGKVKFALGKMTMENPEVENVPRGTSGAEDALSAGRIVPVYSLTAGISQKILRSLVDQVLKDFEGKIEDFMPPHIISRHKLCDRDIAILNIHFPASPEAYFKARRRLVFDELFLMQIALLWAKGYVKGARGRLFADINTDKILSVLPFKLTDDQQKVVWEISRDLEEGLAVNRLIQGDVGSGKTAVAMVMCFLAVKNGGQAAIMVPTETLATQHYLSFIEIFNKLGIKCRLLTGSLKAAEKRKIKAEFLSGEAQIAIGTHALIQDGVNFADLALVVTDEQHRFGVRQRAKLNEKGEKPHILVMTATPIPRSLAMVLYGDLDISVIKQLPPGRQKIDTFCVTSAYHKRIFDFIKAEVEKGQQAYIICPVIEESEHEDFKSLNSVVSFAEKLKGSIFTDVSLEILHGRMKAEEKNRIMTDFAQGRTKILVSTTVIEVGINVPNATIILIENAERFGLSQLHQLRGRVGRSNLKSYCILVTDADNSVTKRRMEAMVSTNDGFKLAELDLEIRGPGEFFGTMQHGIPQMRLANLYKDMLILEEAKEAVREFLEANPRMFHVEHFAPSSEATPLNDRVLKLLENFQQISL